jgi:hypothetical protein
MQPRETRHDWRWKQLARQFKAHCRNVNALCWLCVRRGDAENALIDYDASANSPYSFHADHLQPWDQYPELRYEWANLAPAHHICNKQKHNRSVDAIVVEGVWVKPDW